MFMHTNVKLDGEMVIALYFGIALLVIIFDIGVSDAYCIIISLINLDPLQLSLSLSFPLSPSLLHTHSFLVCNSIKTVNSTLLALQKANCPCIDICYHKL